MQHLHKLTFFFVLSKSWSTIQDFQKLISIGYLNDGTMCTCMVNGIQCAHIKYTFDDIPHEIISKPLKVRKKRKNMGYALEY
uniref:SWIM-type domain-containing protein n=1 Tax=Strongyloides papillosus TaxID=174720 RepID=A0A0N5BBZ7_STREA